MLPLDLKTWYDANAAWLNLLALILAIVAIPLTLWLWRRPYRKKVLGCERISGYSLIQVAANQRDKHPLKLVYDSHDVTAPYITVLRVGNMGDEGVKADEFDDPITIDFTKGRLLAYDVIDKIKTQDKACLHRRHCAPEPHHSKTTTTERPRVDRHSMRN